MMYRTANSITYTRDEFNGMDYAKQQGCDFAVQIYDFIHERMIEKRVPYDFKTLTIFYDEDGWRPLYEYWQNILDGKNKDNGGVMVNLNHADMLRQLVFLEKNFPGKVKDGTIKVGLPISCKITQREFHEIADWPVPNEFPKEWMDEPFCDWPFMDMPVNERPSQNPNFDWTLHPNYKKGWDYRPDNTADNSILYKSLANEVKRNTAYDYTAMGYVKQNERAEYYRSQGLEVLCEFGNDKADLTVSKNGVFLFVESVKAYSLDRQRNNGHVHARTISRKDIMPEINEAIRLNVPLKLSVCNLLNGKWEVKTVDAHRFIRYTTTPELADLSIIVK